MRILIAGAGPAGSTAAYWLAAAGHEVTVLEKTRFPREKVCGDGLTPRAVREMRLMGLPHDAEHGYRRQRGLRLRAAGRRVDVPFESQGEFPGYGLVRTRYGFDADLAAHARAAGARILEGRAVHEVIRAGQTDTGTSGLTPADLRFGYRDSVIKRSMLETGAPSPRWIVLSIDLRLRRASSDAEPTAPVRYGQLAAALDVEEGAHAPLAVVRREVLALRAAKGMVSDPADPDTWSTGSYFTNPIVPASVRASLPDGAPAFAAGQAEDGTPLVKLSAAWLIDRAGFAKGFGLPEVAPREGGPDGRGADGTGLAGGRASVSTKHTLAMTNRGDATTEDVLTIARTVRDGVRERFGVELHPEPMIIGTSL